MKLISFAVSGRSSYGAVVGDGVVDLGRRFGDRYPTLRAAIAGGALEGAATEVSGGAPDIALSQVTFVAADHRPRQDHLRDVWDKAFADWAAGLFQKPRRQL